MKLTASPPLGNSRRRRHHYAPLRPLPRPRITAAERTALGESGLAFLGPDTLDIHLNEAAYWQNVPRPVWEYTLGGCQVLRKWLSYREQTLLGRPLTVNEVAYLTQTTRRIAALLHLAPRLDSNYAAVKSDTYAWRA